MSKLKGLAKLRRRSFRGAVDLNEDFDFAEWNKNLKAGEWDKLSEVVYKIVETESKQKSKSPRKGGVFRQNQNEEKQQQPRLLQLDGGGHAPLHLILSNNEAPKDLLLRMIEHQPEATTIAGKVTGKLPLHLAVGLGHDTEVIQLILSHNQYALSEKDSKGRTPISLAMKLAKSCLKEKKQKRQEKPWGTLKCLLQEILSNPSFKTALRGEIESILLETIKLSAPPTVVTLVIEGSSEKISEDTEFASAVLSRCITEKYPTHIIKSVTQVCPEEVGAFRDENGFGLVSLQFTAGLFKKPEGSKKWKPRLDRIDMVEACLEAKSTEEIWDDKMLDWWNRMKHLIIFCGQSSEEEDSILCDALSNPDTPPLVVQLLLAIEVDIYSNEWRTILPIHVAASTPSYVPKVHEIGNVRTPPLLEIVSEIGNVRPVFCRYNDRVPLHLAIECGKSWGEIKPLVSGNRRTVMYRDPDTKLYPFQLAATTVVLDDDEVMKRASLQARSQHTQNQWDRKTKKEQDKLIQESAESESLERLRTVYELLRRSPTTMYTATRQTKPTKQLRDGSGMGMLAAHFILWCFIDEKRVFIPNLTNIEAFREVIRQGSMQSASDEFQEWWKKAKFWIWYCFCGEIGTVPKDGKLVIPRKDEYLLHAALSNSDTPPQVVHLLLNLFPASSSLPLPNTGVLPLHLTASSGSYLPRRYEGEGFPTATRMDLILNSNPQVVGKPANGRFALHMALECGKTWGEIEGLVVVDEDTLAIKDPVTGLLPFQLAALKKPIKPERRQAFQWTAHNRVSEREWKKMAMPQRNRAIRAEQLRYDRNTLSTVYRLVLARPDLVDPDSPVYESQVIYVKKTKRVRKHEEPEGEDASESIDRESNLSEEDHPSALEDPSISYVQDEELPSDEERPVGNDQRALVPALQDNAPLDEDLPFDEERPVGHDQRALVPEMEDNAPGDDDLPSDEERLVGSDQKAPLPDVQQSTPFDEDDDSVPKLVDEKALILADEGGQESTQDDVATTELELAVVNDDGAAISNAPQKGKKKSKKQKGRSKSPAGRKQKSRSKSPGGRREKKAGTPAGSDSEKKPVESSEKIRSKSSKKGAKSTKKDRATKASGDMGRISDQKESPRVEESHSLPASSGEGSAHQESHQKESPRVEESHALPASSGEGPARQESHQKESPRVAESHALPTSSGEGPARQESHQKESPRVEESHALPASSGEGHAHLESQDAQLPSAVSHAMPIQTYLTTEPIGLQPKPKEISPTFGYYDAKKVEQSWLRDEGKKEVYVRSGFVAKKRAKGVKHWAENTDKNLPCLVCKEEKREALILPCRHLCVCRKCSVKKSLQECPLCAEPVKSTTVIHL